MEFDNNAPAYSHELWRDQATGLDFSPLTTLAAGVSTYDDGATGLFTHNYKVRAIGNGDPSAFTQFGNWYRNTAGRIFLRADDGNWYGIGAARDELDDDTMSIDVDQASTSQATFPDNFGGNVDYICLNLGGSNYAFRLIVDGGTVTYAVDQTPTGGSLAVDSLNLIGPDRLPYALTLVNVAGEIDVQLAQAPVNAPDAPVLLTLTQTDLGSGVVQITWTEPASADYYEFQWKTDLNFPDWQDLASTSAFGVAARDLTTTDTDHDTVSVRMRSIQTGLPSLWSNVLSYLKD